MQAAEAILPRAHARLRRVDMRVAVGLILMLVAVFGGASLIKTAQARIPVIVAAANVQPGQVITASDLRIADVSLAGGIQYVSASMRDQLVGRVATEPLWDGKLLGPGSVSQAPPLPAGMVAMSVALKPDRAVAGNVGPGDHVAVIASPNSGSAGGQTTILLTSVEVLGVSRAAAEEGGGVIVTLKLRLEQARVLASARAAGQIDFVLLSGAAS